METGWDGETTKVPWHKYEGLPDALVKLLKMGQAPSRGLLAEGSAADEAVFPALDVIRRAGPPDGFKDGMYEAVAWYLGSNKWQVREIAARTLCSFLMGPGWLERIEHLIHDSLLWANRLHGALLTLKFLLERLSEAMPEQLNGGNRDGLLTVVRTLLIQRTSLRTCAEARAVFFELVSLIERLRAGGKMELLETPSVGSLATGESTVLFPGSDAFEAAAVDLSGSRPTSREASVLLSVARHTAVYEYMMRQAHPRINGGNYGFNVQPILEEDENVAGGVLEYIWSFPPAAPPDAARAKIMPLHIAMEVCFNSSNTNNRAAALAIVSRQLDMLLPQGKNRAAIPVELKHVMRALWVEEYSKPMGPGLADSLIQLSGAIVAMSLPQRADRPRDAVLESLARGMLNLHPRAQALPPADSVEMGSLGSSLEAWGVSIASAGMDDKPFDTRKAAVQALDSFVKHAHLDFDTLKGSQHLPWLFALYDALNDDDDEIRDIAAVASKEILGGSMIPMQAADSLLAWLGPRYETSQQFASLVTGRMTGRNFLSMTTRVVEAEELLTSWVPAATQLSRSLVFDDALFVIEEQNLYIDKVREAERFRQVLLSIIKTSGAVEAHAAASVAALKVWTMDGMRALLRTINEQGYDGPLGWTSNPAVFIICARILLSASVLSSLEGSESISSAQQDVAAAARAAAMNFNLLNML
jgi:hypothetical protein